MHGLYYVYFTTTYTFISNMSLQNYLFNFNNMAIYPHFVKFDTKSVLYPCVISMCPARLKLFAKTLRNLTWSISRTSDQLRVSSNIFSLPRTATQSFLVMSSELLQVSHSYELFLLLLCFRISQASYDTFKALDSLSNASFVRYWYFLIP